MAERALTEGVHWRQLTGELRRHVEAQVQRHGKGRNTRIYAETIFIFEKNLLITCFPLPGRLRAAAVAAVKRRKEGTAA